MKRFILSLTVSLFALVAAASTEFEITWLSTPDITINNRAHKVGSKFDSSARIQWKDSRQSMKVKNLSNGRTLTLSQKVMGHKGNANKLDDYIFATQRASSRGDGAMPLYTEGQNKASFPEKRLALVIGNSNYDHLSTLRNSQKDAQDIGDVLSQLGFDLLEAYECNYDDMKNALDKFTNMAPDYDVALFYYAGHGLQDEGQNYLIPIQARLEMKSELRECLNAADVVQRMDDAGTPSRIVMLDACRDSKQSWSRSALSGLARMEGSRGSVVLFSTESGKVALDGDGVNSPFATAVLSNIVKGGITFAQAMNDVVNETFVNTGEMQWPLLVGSLFGNFGFNPKGIKVSLIGSTGKGGGTAAPAKPAPMAPKQPKYRLDCDMDFYLQEVRRSGTSLMITFYLTATQGNLDPHILLHDGYNKTLVVDNEGNNYTSKNIKFTTRTPSGSNTDLEMPRGVPVKVTMRITNFSEEATSLTLFNIAFDNTHNNAPYGSAGLKARDIPIPFEAPAPKAPRGELRTVLTAPDIDLKVTDCVRYNDGARVTIVLTNNTGRDLEPLLGEGGRVLYKNIYITDEGEIVVGGDYISVTNSNGDNVRSFPLPDGVPVKLTVNLKKIPEGSTVIPYLGLGFQKIDRDEPYGVAAISIRNLPIK